MTLGNMRANGVRTVAVYYGGQWCDHEAMAPFLTVNEKRAATGYGAVDGVFQAG